MKPSDFTAKGLFSLLVLFSLLAGALSLGLDRPAEAKAKKVVRKIKHKKKLVRKIARKVKRKVVKHKVSVKAKKKPAIKLKKKVARVPKKTAAVQKPNVASAPAAAADYDLPAVSGSVSQIYAVEEGIGEPEVGNLVGALKSIGAQDAYADTSRNTLTVTFNSSKVTSAAIIKKLKTLGYTAKRQK